MLQNVLDFIARRRKRTEYTPPTLAAIKTTVHLPRWLVALVDEAVDQARAEYISEAVERITGSDEDFDDDDLVQVEISLSKDTLALVGTAYLDAYVAEAVQRDLLVNLQDADESEDPDEDEGNRR